MHRFRKLLVFVGAATLALILTVERRGQHIRIAAEPSLSAAMRSEGSAYDLAQAQVFSKTLYYIKDQYFDPTRPDPKRMLVGALVVETRPEDAGVEAVNAYLDVKRRQLL